MTPPTLHHLHDPPCGWRYGAAPLVRAAREVVAVVAHGGGMMTGGNRQTVSPQLRGHVMPHDQRIAQLTGQPFGAAYHDVLLRDTSAELSGEPTRAHIAESRALLNRVGGAGFPTFVLEHEGHMRTIDIGPNLGRAETWRNGLSRQLDRTASAS